MKPNLHDIKWKNIGSTLARFSVLHREGIICARPTLICRLTYESGLVVERNKKKKKQLRLGNSKKKKKTILQNASINKTLVA